MTVYLPPLCLTDIQYHYQFSFLINLTASILLLPSIERLSSTKDACRGNTIATKTEDNENHSKYHSKDSKHESKDQKFQNIN